uniref:non-specific serine/threonine protein kinase n=1 Tax=Macrostomum lignano TaxID=282301 RepID=A0A1I8G9L5_9PLAT
MSTATTDTTQTPKTRVLSNRYRVVRQIGKGAFGTVHLVEDLRSSEEKFKVLKEVQIGEVDPDETLEVVHEAKLLGKLDHSAILKFYNCFMEPPSFCIVTEYCDEGDLDQCISRLKQAGHNLPVQTTIRWFIQILLGVDYLHGRRILHRDLKTKNIFLKSGTVKIGDFGISRVLMSNSDMASTFLGTPYFMSPELLKHEGYNAKSDIWSVGCILYEMCALEHAFKGAGLMGILFSICGNPCPVIPDRYPPELQAVLEKMLAKDPQDRLSAREVLKEPFIREQMQSLREAVESQSGGNRQQQLLMEETINEAESKNLLSVLQEKPTLNSLEFESRAMAAAAAAAAEVTLKPNSDTVRQKVKGPGQAGGDFNALSPHQKMLLRKQREADDRARELATQAAETSRRNAELAKKFGNRTFRPSGSEGRTAFPQPQDDLPVRNQRFLEEQQQQRQQQKHTAWESHDYEPRHNEGRRDSEEDYYGNDGDDSDEEDDLVPASLARRQPTRPTAVASSRDERPITPMKIDLYQQMNRAGSFKEAAMENEELADTYYQNRTDVATERVFGREGRETMLQKLRDQCRHAAELNGFSYDEVYSFLKKNLDASYSVKSQGLQRLTGNQMSAAFPFEQLVFLESVDS